MLTLEKLSNAVVVRDLVGQRDRDAVALVGPDRQRLALGAVGERARPCPGPGRRSCPSWSTKVGVRWIGLRDRDDVVGALGATRRAQPVLALGPGIWTRAVHGLARRPRRARARPVWPSGVNGGRSPMWVRSSGYAGRPLTGLNRMAGRLPTMCPRRSASRLGCPGKTMGESV